MYGKLAMNCFIYKVYLYGSEAITYCQWWAAILKNVSFKAIQIPNF
jgi:hypothetical protein